MLTQPMGLSGSTSTMALVVPIAPLASPAVKRHGGEKFRTTFNSKPALSSLSPIPVSSTVRWTSLRKNSTEVGLRRRRCTVGNSTERLEVKSLRNMQQVLESAVGARMQLVRKPVGGVPIAFPAFAGSSAFLGQKLNGSVRFRRQRSGSVIAAASSNGRNVESEDGVDEAGEDVEIREVIDVPNEAEARDATVEADIKQKEDYRMFREALEVQRKRFWHNLKEQHQVYKADREEWGVGLNPIFTVYEDAEGKRYRVDVDEDEIWLRSGVDPQFPQFADDDAREVVDRRIAKAYALARKIVEGGYEPNELSVLYKFQKDGQETTVGSVRWDGDKEFAPPNFLPTPFRNVNFGSMFAFLVIGGFAYKWWSGRKTKRTNELMDEREIQLMKMRKLKAKMNEKQIVQNPEVLQQEDTTKQDGNGAGRKREPPETDAKNAVVDVTPSKEIGMKPTIEDEEFQKKVEEIRAMARQVRLQEEKSADAQSAQNLERLQRKRSMEKEMEKKMRSKELESLAGNLDDVRRLGSADEDSTATFNVRSTENTTDVNTGISVKSQNGKPPTEEELSMPQDPTTTADKPSTPVSIRHSNGKANPSGQLSSGVKPRIILSPKEARASIAAKRARLESGDSSATSRKSGSSMEDLKAKIKNKRAKADAESVTGTPKEDNGAVRDAPTQSSQGISGSTSEVPLAASLGGSSGECTANGQVSRLNLEGVPAVPSGEQDVRIPTGKDVLNTSEQPISRAKKDEGTAAETREKRPAPSKEEAEEQEWMNDEVLRDIVFKVQANEEAGREPFFGLNSEQEKRFFRGLERKFEREGDRVKNWIKDRVENIDYGADGVSFLDPPEAYTVKWKEGMVPGGKASELSKRFSEDRTRLMQQQSGRDYTSSQPVNDDDDVQPGQPGTSASRTMPSVSPKPQPTNIGQGKTKEIISNSGKTIVTSSGRPPAFSPGTASDEKSEEEPAGSWQHTKRWAKDLQRKYESEKDPETRALMREIGQDLDRWITEEEIEEASRLLEKGVEGEQEYVRMHYEKTKAKIRQQREMFGREAMMSKYGEYKPEQEEPELWWFDLPYVLCLGLQSTVDGEVQSGLYSVDIGPAIEGVGDTSDVVHTVAFQDRGDAHNFCRLLQQESTKLGADGVEVIPFEPKELYKDAKGEGYKVTVIKKGQLQLSIDQPLEEVEARILEIGSARYFDDLLRDRSIDMDAVIDEGLGYGQNSQI